MFFTLMYTASLKSKTVYYQNQFTFYDIILFLQTVFLLVAGLRRVKDPLYLAESISGGCDALVHWCDKPIRVYVPWLNPLTPESD